MAQEILTTFEDDFNLQAVSLVPSSTSGQFQVTCHQAEDNDNAVVLWDRKERGGFPEMKELKQLLRDQVAPKRFLGHSDSTERKNQEESSASTVTDTPTKLPAPDSSNSSSVPFVLPTWQKAPSPNLSIVYCTGCHWLFRAAWFAQEFLQTFAEEVESISLLPSRPPVQGGTFQIYKDGQKLWDRAEQGGFPEIKSMKQLLRDQLNPGKDLGHVDGVSVPAAFDTMDDDDAEEARRIFGVL